MDQIKRITEMEALFDEAREVLDQFSEALDKYDAIQSRIAQLDEYYCGDEWTEDFEADEAGLLPADLKRGVLSEDAIFDLLDDNQDLAADMLQIVSQQIRDGSL